jgi:hypothetical protein
MSPCPTIFRPAGHESDDQPRSRGIDRTVPIGDIAPPA